MFFRSQQIQREPDDSDVEEEYLSLNYFETNGHLSSSEMPSHMPSAAPSDTSESSSPSSGERDNRFIDALNRLQNTLTLAGEDVDIRLPEIAVVGSQSSGKSSILESFVGRDFLPRGQGCVTKTPVIIQLITHKEEYGEFLHKPGVKFTDFEDIKREIIRVTESICKPQEFSKQIISLKIYSPYVLKLTLVDLPGLIKVTSNQSESTVKEVEEIVLNYIKPDNVIILAVTPAVIDAATSDAIAFARKVDPDASRTIGVLTKCDRIEEGVNPRQLLDNREFFKRGWVGVVNRPPKDKDENISREDMLKLEEKVFSAPEYDGMRNRMGIKYLQKLLQGILRDHVKKHIESVRTNIHNKRCQFEEELAKLSAAVGDGPSAKLFFLSRLIESFKNDLNVSLIGYSENVPSNKFTAGAMINKIFNSDVHKKLTSLSLVPDDEKMMFTLSNLNGCRNSISWNNLAVNQSCKELLDNFKVPIKESVQLVMEVLFYAVNESAKVLDGYPELQQDLVYIVGDWITQEATKTNVLLNDMLEAEEFYYNYNHPQFVSKSESSASCSMGNANIWQHDSIEIHEEKSSGENSKDINKVENGSEEFTFDSTKMTARMKSALKDNKDMKEAILFLRSMVIKYFAIVSVKIYDTTIKILAFFLCKKFLDRVLTDLGPTMCSPDKMEKLAGVFKHDFQRIEDLRLLIKTMTEALKAIEKF